jgi:hypothetical protein
MTMKLAGMTMKEEKLTASLKDTSFKAEKSSNLAARYSLEIQVLKAKVEAAVVRADKLQDMLVSLVPCVHDIAALGQGGMHAGMAVQVLKAKVEAAVARADKLQDMLVSLGLFGRYGHHMGMGGCMPVPNACHSKGKRLSSEVPPLGALPPQDGDSDSESSITRKIEKQLDSAESVQLSLEFVERSKQVNVPLPLGQESQLEAALKQRYATIAELERKLVVLQQAAAIKMKKAELNSLSVSEMKSELKARGLPVSGKKEVLAERLMAVIHRQ